MIKNLPLSTPAARYAAQVRALYGAAAASVTVHHVGARVSLLVQDARGDVLSPDDAAPWADLMALLDDTLAAGLVGTLELAGDAVPAEEAWVPAMTTAATSIALPW